MPISHRTEPPSKGAPLRLPGALGDLARAVGGTTALANLLYVTPMTIQRWARVPPPRPMRLLLARLAAEHGLSARAQMELETFNERRPPKHR